MPKRHGLFRKTPPDIVVFLDADFSDFPEDLDSLVTPLLQDEAVFCLGARTKSLREKGSLTPQQRFGNALACTLMRWIYGGTFTDLGPFRAIQWKVLKTLDMQDKTYGWTIEMQLKILRRKLPYKEIPVRYRKRIGVSKVSGTLKGTVLAGIKIIGWIGKFYFFKMELTHSVVLRYTAYGILLIYISCLLLIFSIVLPS